MTAAAFDPDALPTRESLASAGKRLEDGWRAARENAAKLAACAGPHAFALHAEDAGKAIGGRYVCAGCGGEVDHHGFRWYQAGLAHGRGAR